MSKFSRRQFHQYATISALLPNVALTSKAQSSHEKVRIGQIGTKHGHAEGKLRTILNYPELFEFVGLVEPDEERKNAIQDKGIYREVKWMSEEQLLNTPDLKAVAVETDVHNLVPTAHRCVNAGMHLHLDKPAGPSLDEFRNLLLLAEQKQLVIQMGYMFRTNPGFRLMYKAVREGWLGNVFEIHGVSSKKSGPEARKEWAQFSGGKMFELGYHLIDSLVHIMGSPQTITPFLKRTHPEMDSLADNCLAVFEYPKATCTIRSSVLEPFGFERRQFITVGEKGTVEIRPLERPKVLLALEEERSGYERGYQKVNLPEAAGRYDEQFLELHQLIVEQKEPEFSKEHDLAVHEAVLKASGMLD